MAAVRRLFTVLPLLLALAACGTSSAPLVGPGPGDDRAVLTSGGRDTMAPSGVSPCAVSFRASDATETVPYENASRSLRFDLPYDAEWGTDEYAVPAYEQTDAATVLFGPAVKRGAECRWERAMRLEFVAAREAPDVAADAKRELLTQLKVKTLEIGSEPQVLAAPTYTAVESLSVTPECRVATLEIVRPAGNVRIRMCGKGAKRIDDFRPLRAIAKSMTAL